MTGFCNATEATRSKTFMCLQRPVLGANRVTKNANLMQIIVIAAMMPVERRGTRCEQCR
jgi:hypothetical protein